jgi:hypothetical protein
VKGNADPAPSPPEVDKKPTNYTLSAAGNSGLKSLAELAPTLKEGELRVLLYLEALTENNNPHATRISMRDIAAGTKMALSAVQRAIESLGSSPGCRALISRAPGTATKPSFIAVHTFGTTKIGVPFRGTPPAGTPSTEGCDSNRHTAYLLEAQGAPSGGTPQAENKELRAEGARVDFDSDLTSVIDRLLSAKARNLDPDLAATARHWMHGYAAKFAHEPNPHPPDDTMVAQFLAIAPWPRLERLLHDLMAERQEAGHSYAWFISVAMQRIHGVKPELLKQARQQLKIIRRAKGETPDPQFTEDLVKQIASGKGVK